MSHKVRFGQDMREALPKTQRDIRLEAGIRPAKRPKKTKTGSSYFNKTKT